MPHHPHPFRLVHRSFDRVVFDRVKSDNVFTLRGFDLGCAAQMFPGYVLERPMTPHPAEARLLVLGEIGRVVLLLSCTRMGRTCRLMTGWVASPAETALWFASEDAGPPDVTLLRGRFDVARLGDHHPHDDEPRPVLTPEDMAATREELSALRVRMIPWREPVM